MKLLTLASFLVPVFADRDIGFGVLSMSLSADIHSPDPAMTSKDGLGMGLFDYYQKVGALVNLETRKFLHVDERGSLILRNEPDQNFLLGNKSKNGRKLSYKGIDAFQLCGDDTIDFTGSRKGAYTIEIYYQEVA
ncbi:hypothetical protein OXX59_008294 [Metschnikowia pulcherrima]